MDSQNHEKIKGIKIGTEQHFQHFPFLELHVGWTMPLCPSHWKLFTLEVWIIFCGSVVEVWPNSRTPFFKKYYWYFHQFWTILKSIVDSNFLLYPPGEGGIKIKVVEFFCKSEFSISKFERVMAIYVSQGYAKSQFLKILKS